MSDDWGNKFFESIEENLTANPSESTLNDVLCERSLKKPLLTYEAWRVSFQSSEQAANAAYVEALRQCAEKERLRGALIRARQALMDSEGPFYDGMKILNEHT